MIVTTTPPGSQNQDDKISKIVLQNKRVLSVAQSVEQKDGKPQVARSITVEVTPEESEKLSLATQEGQIVLALRSTGMTRMQRQPEATNGIYLLLRRRPVKEGAVVL